MKLYLCLGGTVNQFNQAQILGAFRAALKREDRLLVGLNFFPPEHSEQFLRKLADAYSEQTDSIRSMSSQVEPFKFLY